MRHRQKRFETTFVLILLLITLGCGEGEFFEPRKSVHATSSSQRIEYSDSSFHDIITRGGRDRLARVQALIEKGGDLDEVKYGAPPCIQAVSWGGQYDIALLLLEAGADFNIYVYRQNTKMVHVVAREKERLPYVTPSQRRDYGRLVSWLERHGESISQAEKDWARWKAFSPNRKIAARQHEAERQARLQREAKEAATEQKKAKIPESD